MLQGDKTPIAHYGLLSTDEKPCKVQGRVMDVSFEALATPDADLKGLGGILRGEFQTQAKGSRAIGQLNRLAQKLQAAGVQALLLECESDSEWIKQAELARLKPKLDRGDRAGIPILLIPSSVRIDGDAELKASGLIRDDKRMRNVIGLLRGSDETLQKQAILYSAHLDHLGSNPALEDDQIYNGADDDASGVTAVVTLADAIGAMKERPKRSVLFMAFWGEESGLLGSKQFVSNPSWQLDQIVANINIEMIGRPEGGARGKIWMTGWRESDLGVIMSQAAKPWGVEIFEHPKFSSMLYRASDNWSFVERGVIAHSFSAGSLHPDYHQVDDEWDRLEIPHMTQVIQGLWLGSLPLLDGTQTPGKATNSTKESK
ncbi:MAG: M28 family peptidase [Planctomycetota bacterium]